jgi:phage tail-like protein
MSAMTSVIRDPYTNYNFLVELDQIIRGAFQQVSGLDSTVEVVEYREGGDPVMRKLAGHTTHSNIVLKWGIAVDSELGEWHRRISQDPSNLAAERRGGGILLMNSRGDTVARWDFDRAWPTKYVAPDLNAESSHVAVETVELAHEGIRRVL